MLFRSERDFTYPASEGSDLHRRSLYTFWRRTIAPANMFDVSPRQSCRVRIPVTNSPLHALVTMNDPTYVEAARVLAERAMHAAPDAEARLAHAFERVVDRDGLRTALQGDGLEVRLPPSPLSYEGVIVKIRW